MSSTINSILYADDDPDDHYVFSRIVIDQFPFIRLILLHQCNDVIRYLADKDTILPDVIFLDLNMLGNEKYQCLIEIKNMQRSRHIPVVIYSTSSSPAVANEAHALGAFKFIAKPYSFNDITREIKKVITELEK